MKTKLLALALVVLMGSCGQESGVKIVTFKSYFTNNGWKIEPLPKGLCQFGYNNGFYFQDSCHFYHVGDTLKPRK